VTPSIINYQGLSLSIHSHDFSLDYSIDLAGVHRSP